MATSFFTDADEPIASVLTRTLLETGQEIPDFLKPHVPEEGKDLKFEADSDFEPDEEPEVGAGADEWGGNDGGDGGGDQPGDCTAGAWSAGDVYTGGETVSHAGHTWRAKWWVTGEEPGTTGEWGVWEDLGAC